MTAGMSYDSRVNAILLAALVHCVNVCQLMDSGLLMSRRVHMVAQSNLILRQGTGLILC